MSLSKFPMALAILMFLGGNSASSEAVPVCPASKELSYRMEGSFTRTRPGFTEGLIFRQGWLFESTGSYNGISEVNRINPLSGEVTQLAATPQNAFGEGLTELKGFYYQLTWKEGQVFLNPSSDFNKRTTLSNFAGEGWGLTHDGNWLLQSDGSMNLYYLHPQTLQRVGGVAVREANGRFSKAQLNELEFARGHVFANSFSTDDILEIDPRTGCVLGHLDLASLRGQFTQEESNAVASDQNNVLNGIAYDPGTDLFYVTGKNWPRIFKIKID